MHRNLRFGPTWQARLFGNGGFALKLLAATALGLAIATTCAIGWAAHEAREFRLALQAQVNLSMARRIEASTLERPPQVPLQTIRQLVLTIDRLNAPWRALFEFVERNTPSSVALAALEANAMTGQIKLTVESPNLETLLEYAKALGEDVDAPVVHVQQHEIQMQDVKQTARMVLSVAMRSSGR